MLGPADRAAVAAFEAMLSEYRRRGEAKPALALLATTLGGSTSQTNGQSQLSLVAEARGLWLTRTRGANRGESTLRAYRNAIDGLVAWAADRGRDQVLLTEGAMVEHPRPLPAHAVPDARDLSPAVHPVAALRAVGLSAAWAP